MSRQIADCSLKGKNNLASLYNMCYVSIWSVCSRLKTFSFAFSDNSLIRSSGTLALNVLLSAGEFLHH